MNRFKKFIFRIFLVMFDWYCNIECIATYYLGNIKRPHVFRGSASYKYACKYANKRRRLWKSDWDQAGRRQAVMPWTDTTLIVCSELDLKKIRSNLIRKGINPRKLIRKSYYTTLS
jgi:hypothetical protein